MPVLGKICAIFNPNSNGFCVAVINNEDGKIYTCYSNCIIIDRDRTLSVVLIADPIAKIPAIRVIRSILNLGLKEAKDLVEENRNRIVVKDNLTYDEAVILQNRISSEGMESVIVVKPINSITQE